MPSCVLEVGIPDSSKGDFSKFLALRKEVYSFQKIDNHFLIKAFSDHNEGISILINSINKVYDVTSLKQIPICLGTCRNGTNCLNRAKYGEYCWRHVNVSHIPQIGAEG